ncbi:uncharacterized protein [Halyomorpha halys]|uniref:uncharacterized protein n=1 Tax=Halyomorpha halys TaxID=286706 RepID=UPI0006D5274C|nr:uncharacterized protein LOC106687272 [Halyomorpha halys]
MSLYHKTRNVVRTRNHILQEFETKPGIHQGCCLSPLLFIVVLDKATKEAKLRMRQFQLEHRNLQPIKCFVLAFADDLVFLASNDRDLQYNISVLQGEMPSINMKINLEKTKCMRIGKKPRRIMRMIRANEERLEQIQNFKYLGSHLNERGRKFLKESMQLEEYLVYFEGVSCAKGGDKEN